MGVRWLHIIQGTAQNSCAAMSEEFLPHREASSFILAFCSSAASKEDRPLPTPPSQDHMGRDQSTVAERHPEPRLPKAKPTAPKQPPIPRKGCSTAHPWHSREAQPIPPVEKCTKKRQGCLIYQFSHREAGVALSPCQVQVRALGKSPSWLLGGEILVIRRINKHRAWRGVQHCRLLLRAFNEISMFHFRDKRALCHTGGPRWGEIKKRKLHSSLHPIQEHNANIMPM